MSDDPYAMQKDFSADDRQMDEFLDRMAFNFNASRGVQIGPFDHPEGIGADEPFRVPHSLGQVPDGHLIVEDPGYTGKGVYANSDDRGEWTDGEIVLRSADPANKGIIVRILARRES